MNTGMGEMRGKNWDELSDTEKIERMRDVVKSQGRLIYSLQSVVENLKVHHHKDNEVAISLKYTHNGIIPSHRHGNEDWF